MMRRLEEFRAKKRKGRGEKAPKSDTKEPAQAKQPRSPKADADKKPADADTSEEGGAAAEALAQQKKQEEEEEKARAEERAKEEALKQEREREAAQRRQEAALKRQEAKRKKKEEEERKRKEEEERKRREEEEARGETNKDKGRKKREKKEREPTQAERDKQRAEERRREEERQKEEEERKRKEEEESVDPLDRDVEGELDELALERLAYEAAERAVREEEARRAKLAKDSQTAFETKKQDQKKADMARREAQRMFNEQDFMRRKAKVGSFEGRVHPQSLRCIPCHTVVIGARSRTARAVIEKLVSLGESVVAVARTQNKGIVEVPRWFAEIMAKARFRGVSMKWEAADVRNAATLRTCLQNAKAVVYTAASSTRTEKNSPRDVEYVGVEAVAKEALEAGVERFVLISAAGVTRPWKSTMEGVTRAGATWRLGALLSGRLSAKRKGELALIKVAQESMGMLTYTVIRPTFLGNSSHEAAFSVKAHDVVLSQGDHAQGSITRSEVGALAVEAIFIPAAYNVVLEAASSARSLSRQKGVPQQAQPKTGLAKWDELLSWMRAGDGRYISPQQMTKLDQLRDLQQYWTSMALEEEEYGGGGVVSTLNA